MTSVRGHGAIAITAGRRFGCDARADDAPAAWWFAAKSPARPITPALAWRVWKGAAGHRQWNPDVLAIETPAGDVIATRYLGAVSKVEPIAVDPAVPTFLASVLENDSGVDDEITLLVLGFIDHELRVLRSVNAGPRSLMGRAVLGPLGSVTATTANGHHALRIREITPNVDSPCTPGSASDPGCAAMEHVEAWEPTAGVFVSGTSSPIVLRQKTPGGPITVTPR